MRSKRKHTHAVPQSSGLQRFVYLALRIILAATLGVLAYQLAATPLTSGDQHIVLTMDMRGYDTRVIQARVGKKPPFT